MFKTELSESKKLNMPSISYFLNWKYRVYETEHTVDFLRLKTENTDNTDENKLVSFVVLSY